MSRSAVFCTTEAELVLPMIAYVRQHWPQSEWTVYASARHHDAIAAACPGAVLIDDKPAGSKLAFLRAVRRARYGMAVVAWHGHAHLDRLKLVALLSGAGCVVACDEELRTIVLQRGCAAACIRHLRRRRRQGQLSVLRALVPLAWLYRVTFGFGIALGRSLWAAHRWRALRR